MFSATQSPIKVKEIPNPFTPLTPLSLLDETADCSVVNTSTTISEDKTSFWKKYVTIKLKNNQEPNIMIVKRREDDETTEIALKIMDILSTYKSKVFFEEDNTEDLEKAKSSDKDYVIRKLTEKDINNLDLLITIGGDGTILKALTYFNSAQVPPILSFSKGTRNYLCNFAKEGYESTIRKYLDDICNGKPIQIENRDRLQCEIKNIETGERNTYYALNEVAIIRGGLATLAKVDCYLEGKYLATFDGDGVMIATPTGSTAYQLSAGGPIINHLDSSMTLTPIAPLNLTTRPVVLPPQLQLAFTMSKDSRKNIQVNIDGQIAVEISKSNEISVTGASVPLTFLRPEDSDAIDNWIHKLRDLVGWNRSSSGYPL